MNRTPLGYFPLFSACFSVALGCSASHAPIPITVTCLSRVEPFGADGTPAPQPPLDAGLADAVTVADSATDTPRVNPTVARWGTSWQPVRVLDTVCAGFVRVHFDADPAGDDEVVSLREVQERDAQGRPPEVHTEAPGLAVTHAAMHPGARVLALSGGQWYPSRVRALRRNGRVQIRYDGYGAEWDEDMELSSLRLPSTESLTHPAGSAVPQGGAVPDTLSEGAAVQARSRGRWLAARVLGVECGGLARVHMLGWEPAWDAVISRENLRTSAPAP